VKTFFYKCSNSGRNETTPQTQNKVSWISSKAELEISFIKTRLEMRVWESGLKIDPSTGVRSTLLWFQNFFVLSVFEHFLYFMTFKNLKFFCVSLQFYRNLGLCIRVNFVILYLDMIKSWYFIQPQPKPLVIFLMYFFLGIHSRQSTRC